jgi:DNA-binding IclR family transcriptional regulator
VALPEYSLRDRSVPDGLTSTADQVRVAAMRTSVLYYETERRPSAGIQVIDRAAALLGVLAESRKPVPLREIAEKAGLQRSTTRRILGTLENHGFCERDEASRYRLGLRLFELGTLVQRRFELRDCGRPQLEYLADRSQLTVSLCVLQNRRAVCIDRIDGHHAHSLALAVGGSLPLHAGAAPRALLAHLPDTELDAYLDRPPDAFQQLTHKTIVSPADIYRDVKQIRVRGWSYGDEDVTEGLSAIGAPVFDYTRRAVGAISLSGLTPAVVKNKRNLIALVTEAAQKTSICLGSETSARGDC